MKSQAFKGPLGTIPADMVIAGVFEDKKLPSDFKKLDKAISSSIESALKSDFEGKKDQLFTIDTLGSIKAKKIALVGLGDRNDHSLENIRRACHNARDHADSLKLKSIAFLTGTLKSKQASFLNGLAISEGCSLGQYRFDRFLSEKDEAFFVNDIVLVDADRIMLDGAKKGLVLANDVKFVRDLVQEPANVLNPKYLAEQAKKVAVKHKIRIKVHDKSEIKKLGLNLLLTVARGSLNDPRFIVMELNPAKSGGTAIVGKGITFDSGGLNLKPGQWMDYMKSDMGGAAAVLATMMAAAQLGYRKRLVGIIATAENMISGESMRPGDVVKSFQGKTVEILNTDAEGRLILGDAVAYAETLKPARIIETSTLTGAAISTLGYIGTPILGTDDKTLKELEDAGYASYERVWKLPVWDEYKDRIKSDIADLRNLPKGKGFEAGVISAGLFIEAFINKVPFSHIDIGGTSWMPEPFYYIPKQASGIPTRLLVYTLMGWANIK